MGIDLKSMNRKELEKMLSDVKKALTDAQARERREAKKAAERAAAEFGFSLTELTEGQNPPAKRRKQRGSGGKPKTKSQPKYANPSDTSQTWTGKGRQPNWYRENVEKGIPPEQMKI